MAGGRVAGAAPKIDRSSDQRSSEFMGGILSRPVVEGTSAVLRVFDSVCTVRFWKEENRNG